MNKPKALQLADEWLRKTQSEARRRNSAYDHYGMDNTPENVDPLGAEMAVELRRLHAENEVMRNVANRGGHIAVAMSRIADLEAQRDALLEALQDLCDTLGECGMTERARAAIAAVEESK